MSSNDMNNHHLRTTQQDDNDDDISSGCMITNHCTGSDRKYDSNDDDDDSNNNDNIRSSSTTMDSTRENDEDYHHSNDNFKYSNSDNDNCKEAHHHQQQRSNAESMTTASVKRTIPSMTTTDTENIIPSRSNITTTTTVTADHILKSPTSLREKTTSRKNNHHRSATATSLQSNTYSNSNSNNNNGITNSTTGGGGTGNNNNNSSSSSNANASSDAMLRRVTRVSRHAALTTKQAVWDSNELSIDAALSAVDQWESSYTAFRSILVHSVHSVQGLYGTVKDGVTQLEHGLFNPIRDYILLPAFTGAERAAYETTKFLQSPAARQLAQNTLQLASSVPIIGDNILAPTMKLSVVAVQRTWDVLQYPIPSREQVRSTVDWSLTGTKWAITAAGREIFLYAKRADANITRTLSHTQWKVLGSGPYVTLDTSNRSFVIDHFCERYYAQSTDVARYELAAHIRRHNTALYNDLIVTGLLKERNKDITEYDEWLNPNPMYRDQVWDDVIPFLLPKTDPDCTTNSNNITGRGTETMKQSCRKKRTTKYEVSALWFRWPQVNGSAPAKDSPWICFRKHEQHVLEKKYRQIVYDRSISKPLEKMTTDTFVQNENNSNVQHEAGYDTIQMGDVVHSSTTPKQTNRIPQQYRSSSSSSHMRSPPTIAQWYVTNPNTDVMVDQQRYSVTFSLCCIKCRKSFPDTPASSQTKFHPPLVMPPPAYQYGDECEACRTIANNNNTYNPGDQPSSTTSSSTSSSSFVLPPISTIMRPNFWRFYGNGDDVRRATWVLDTARNGLQPFDYDAQAVLEDAYLFLKWLSYRRSIDPNKKRISNDDNGDGTDTEGLDETLLTVEVPGPDGTDRLVQFSSLTRATAIQKGLGAAMALFKRRVYRGAWLEQEYENIDDDLDAETSPVLHNSGNEDQGKLVLPDHIDESLRSLLIPPPPPIIQETSSLELEQEESEEETSLAVPRERLKRGDMAKLLDDQRDGTIDHLCLIVHGIGEMMRSVDLFGLTLPNLSMVCGSMRNNHAEVQAEHIPQMYPKTDVTSSTTTSTIGRVEYLPVEWHEAFSILTQRRAPVPDIIGRNVSSTSSKEAPRNVMIEDISLKTIPNMREFANDTLMDVLFFMNPEHHQIIIDVVTHEMNLVFEKFRAVTGFTGRISVIGHSLGSVITWDVLNNQNIEKSSRPSYVPLHNVGSMESIGSTSGYYSPANASEESDYSTTPELTPNDFSNDINPPTRTPDCQSTYPQLNFSVDNFFLLGSPVPVFLMIRNQRKPLSTDFSLSGCRRVFNIFHPYDPVAYRLEGCIDPRNAHFEPALIRHWNGGFRVQYRTRRIWRQIVATTSQTQRTVMEAFEQSMVGAFGIDRNEDDSASEASADKNQFNKVVTGALNEGRRIDFMLQEKEIENANEYVAALAAHSSYWIEKDLSLFIARQIYLSALEYAAEFEEEAAADMGATWDIITPEQHKM